MKQYKRFFAFGCSFTEHIYPTWADVVRKSFLSTEFYNFGRTGAGNLQISVRVAEANTRYKFNEDDLVMVMFSGFCREDRWVKNRWQSYGNVYNNDYYDKSFYKYCDPLGYAIKDLGLIELTTNYLKNTPATVHLMPAFPINNFTSDIKDDEATEQKIINLYETMYNEMPIPLFNYLGSDYPKVNCGNYEDTHPNPWSHFEYIENNVMKLNDNSRIYAKEWTETLTRLNNRDDIINYFNHVVYRNEGLF